MPLEAGDPIDRYRILERLGAGGMGEVYRARDPRLLRDVALKILRPSLGTATLSDPASDGAARVLREARAAAALEHPNVVAVYDVGEIQEPLALRGTPYIAMELVKGRSLRAYVGAPDVPMEERLRWLVDVARALAAAHKAGLVHRDVKPENVMIRDDGVVKVLDFGIAKPAEVPRDDVTSSTEALLLPHLTARGAIVGTPRYMPPEQMRGEALDGRADQFAWGVVAYELLAGRPPWVGDGDLLHVVSQVLSTDPPAPRSVSPELPEGVDAVVMRALAKARDERFASMDDLVSALAAASNVPASPAADASPSVARRRAGRGRALLTAVGLIAFLGAAAWRARGSVGGAPPAPSAARHADVAPTEASFPAYGSALSSVREAADAYRAAMQSARDADPDRATSELDRAIALDASFAAAHLRRALVAFPMGTRARDDAREATRLRAGLGAHDRAVLDAIAPLLDFPAQPADAEARLARALEAAPRDADFALLLCRVRSASLRYDAARDACARAKDLDPDSAAALRDMAIVKMHLGDEAGARADFEECLRVSPLATSCLRPLWDLQAIDGRCDAALATARRLVAISPGSAEADDRLATSLLAAGEPLESVRLALAEKLAHTTPSQAGVTSARDAAFLAIATGDFDAARAQLRAWEEAVAASRLEAAHFAPTAMRIQLAAVEGRRAEAAALASDHLKRRPAWTLAPEADYSMYFVGQLYVLGGLPRDELLAKRATWLVGASGDAASPDAWLNAYAIPLATAEDGRDAVAALESRGVTFAPTILWPDVEGPVGRAYRLAARSREALPHLQRAARACSLLSSPFEQTGATYELGLALEDVHRPDEACAAYRVVAARWRRAATSVTARRARERMGALGCAP
jgi:serine/threonine-protein kinase